MHCLRTCAWTTAPAWPAPQMPRRVWRVPKGNPPPHQAPGTAACQSPSAAPAGSQVILLVSTPSLVSCVIRACVIPGRIGCSNRWRRRCPSPLGSSPLHHPCPAAVCGATLPGIEPPVTCRFLGAPSCKPAPVGAAVAAAFPKLLTLFLSKCQRVNASDTNISTFWESNCS